MNFSHWSEFEDRKFNRDLQDCHCGCGCHSHNDSYEWLRRFHDDCCCKQEKRRLNRLELTFAQRLRTLVEETIEIELLSGEEDEIIVGTLCFVGADFLDVCVGRLRRKNVRSIPFHAIKSLRKVNLQEEPEEEEEL